MTTLENLAPKVDVYSIDEAFLDLTGIDRVVSFEEFGRDVKNTVYQDIGLPVCVGIAPTRTLAKLANYAARKYTATGGVVDLTNPAQQRRLGCWAKAQRQATGTRHCHGVTAGGYPSGNPQKAVLCRAGTNSSRAQWHSLCAVGGCAGPEKANYVLPIIWSATPETE